MRCLACDNLLSEWEDAQVYDGTKIRIQLCALCTNASGLGFDETMLSVPEFEPIVQDSDDPRD